jgi:2-phosphosulfolactate phosphatase
MIVDAIVHPSELPHLASRGIGEAVCVVFDILRATSTMVTALEHGVSEIVPAVSIEAALALKDSWPRAFLGGERHGDKIEGFDLGNSPLEYLNLSGAQIISTTTNGTIALTACSDASVVLVGAILNLQAIIDAVRSLAPKRLLAVCSGTGEGVAMEDAWAAGALVEAFQHHRCTDSALTALAVRKHYPAAGEALRISKNGQALQSRGKVHDVEWCERNSLWNTIGIMREGVIRRWERAF